MFCYSILFILGPTPNNSHVGEIIFVLGATYFAVKTFRRMNFKKCSLKKKFIYLVSLLLLEGGAVIAALYMSSELQNFFFGLTGGLMFFLGAVMCGLIGRKIRRKES